MLTEAQIVQRRGVLTASRISPLMTGDAEKIMSLYRQLIGEEEEENLDNNWPAQLGLRTEKLNLDWYEMNNGRLLEQRGEFLLHPDRDWAGATLDGFDPLLGCPIECKHTGGHEAMDIVIDRYQPQCHWQMFVTRTDQCALSVIMGAAEPKVTYIPRDWDYMNTMIHRAERFMMHVGMRTPPPLPQPVPAPSWDNLKTRDMEGNNQFGENAVIWRGTKQAHRNHEDAKDVLKSMITPEEREIFGYGVRVVRDRANRLHVREVKGED